MKTGLTKKQKVTEVFYNAKDPIAEIYTHDTKLKKRLLAFAKDYPELCWQTDDDDQGGLRFEIAKERVSIRLTARYSQERREAASRLVKQNSTFQNTKLRNSNELEGTNTDSALCFPRKCDKIIKNIFS